MSMFNLAISCLTTSSLLWFIDLTFQVPTQYCSLQHHTLHSPADTFITEYHFDFGSASSFFLELFPCFSPIAYWTPPDLGGGAHLLVSFLFAFLYCTWRSWGRNTGVVSHSVLQWVTFCQNSLIWPIHLGWPCMVWLIASWVTQGFDPCDNFG